MWCRFIGVWNPLRASYPSVFSAAELNWLVRYPSDATTAIELFLFFAINASENAKIKVREISAKNISLKEFDSFKSSGMLQNPEFLTWIIPWRMAAVPPETRFQSYGYVIFGLIYPNPSKWLFYHFVKTHVEPVQWKRFHYELFYWSDFTHWTN